MQKISIEDIQNKFETLPEDLKWAIMETKADDKIIDIGQELDLNVAQMGQLSLETQAVMLGFTHPDKFEESVKASLNLPEDRIKSIVNSVNEKILKEIRGKIMELYSPKKDEEKKESLMDLEAEKIKIKNDSIMQSAGIEINPSNLPLSGEAEPSLTREGRVGLENRDDMLNKVENPNLINPVKTEQKGINTDPLHIQKLSGSFKIPEVKTEYTLNNMSKVAGGGVGGGASPKGATPQGAMPVGGVNMAPTSHNSPGASLSPSYGAKADPYRLSPDE